MEQDKLYGIWSYVKDNNILDSVPDYEDFKRDMQNEEKFSSFHAVLRESLDDVPEDPKVMMDDLGLKKKESLGGFQTFSEKYKDIIPSIPREDLESASDFPKYNPWLDIKEPKASASEGEMKEVDKKFLLESLPAPELSKWRNGLNLPNRVDDLLDSTPYGVFSPPDDLTPTEQFEFYKRGIQRKFVSDEAFKGYVDYLVVKDKEKQSAIEKGMTAKDYLRDIGYIGKDIEKLDVDFDVNAKLDDMSFDKMIRSIPELDKIVANRVGEYKVNSAEYIGVTGLLSSAIARLCMIYKAYIQNSIQRTGMAPVSPFGLLLEVQTRMKETPEEEVDSVMDIYRDDVREMQSYLSQRDATFWENTAGGILGIVMDAPVFSIGGKIGVGTANTVVNSARWTKHLLMAGGATEKIAEQAVKKGLGSVIGTSMKATAGALGVHAMANDVLQQMGDKPLDQYSFEQTLKTTTSSTLTGAAIGIIPPVTHALSNIFTQRALDKMFTQNYLASSVLSKAAISRGTVGAVGFGAEVGVFELSHKMQGGEITWDSVLQNAATLGVLKAKGVGKEAIKQAGREVEFTPTEKILLNIKDNKDAINQYSSKEGMNALMQREDIPYLLKSKVTYLTKGLRPDYVPLPADMTVGDGVAKIYDNKGRLIDRFDMLADPSGFVKATVETRRAVDLYNDVIKLHVVSPDAKLKIDEMLKKNGVENGINDAIFTSALLSGGEMSPAQQKASRILNDVIKSLEVVRKPEGKVAETGEKIPVPNVGEKQGQTSSNLLLKKEGYAITDKMVELGAEIPIKNIKDADKVIKESGENKQKVDEIIKQREQQQKIDAEYRIFDRIFTSEAEFIQGLKEFAKRGAFDSDYIGTDIVYKPSKVVDAEIMGIKQTPQKGFALELASTPELRAATNTYDARIKMAQHAKDLIEAKGVAKKMYSDKDIAEVIFGGEEAQLARIESKSEPITPEQATRESRLKELWEQYKPKPEKKNGKRGMVTVESIQDRVSRIKEMLNIKEKLREDIKKEILEKGELKEGTPEFKNAVSKELDNRNPFKDIPDVVRNVMEKKIAEAGLTEAKYDEAVKYIDKVLTDVEYRKYETDRLSTIEKVEKETAPKAVQERGGKHPKAKGKFMDVTDDFQRTISNINELVTKGTSKDFKNPNETIEQNIKRIEELEKNQNGLSKENRDEIVRLKSQNEVLDFANIYDKNIYEVRLMLDKVERFKNGQKLRSQELAEQMHKQYDPMVGVGGEVFSRIFYGAKQSKQIRENDKEIKEIEAKENKSNYDISRLSYLKSKNKELMDSMFNNTPEPPKSTSFFRSLLSTSIYGINSMLMRNDPYTDKKAPGYKDYLNEWMRPLVKKAMDRMDILVNDQYNKVIPQVMEVLGVNTEGQLTRALLDFANNKRIRVRVLTEDGTFMQLENMTPDQAIQKILQWGDARWNKLMRIPYKDIGYGMGFTDATIESMRKQLSEKELALMDFMKKTLDRYAEMYDLAYIKENGVSFRQEQGYWPGRKTSYKPRKVEIGDYELDEIIRQDRTLKRTGDTSPLVRGSAWNDMVSFMNESIRYVSWAEPLRELQYVYKDQAVREAIKRQLGTRGLDIIDDRLASFAGNNHGRTVPLLDELTSNVAGSILGFKPAPMLKQFISSIYYFAEMPVNQLLKSITYAAKNPDKVILRNMELTGLLANDPFYVGRMASVSTAMGLEMENKFALATRMKNVKGQKLYSYIPARQMREIAGQPLRVGDVTPILVMGTWFTALRYRMHSGKDLTNDIVRLHKQGVEDPYLKRAIEDWSWFSEISQQSLRIANRSHFSLQGSVGRTVSTFTSGPLSAHRLASVYARETKKAIDRGDTHGALSALKGVALAHVIGAAIFSLFDDRFNIKDGKVQKNTVINMALGNVEGLAASGRVVALAKQYALDQHFGREGVMPITPVVKALEEAVGSSNELYHLLSSPAKDMIQIGRHTAKLGVAASMLFGMPVDGVLKITKGAMGVSAGAYPAISWQAFGMYEESEKDMPEEVEEVIAELNIGPYRDKDEATQDVEKFISFSPDGKVFMGDKESLLMAARRIALSPAFKDQDNPAQTFISEVYRRKERQRFRALYNRFNQLDSDKGIDEAIKKVEAMLDDEKNEENIVSLITDLEELMEMKEGRMEFATDIYDRIEKGEEYVEGLWEKMMDKGMEIKEVGKSKNK